MYKSIFSILLLIGYLNTFAQTPKDNRTTTILFIDEADGYDYLEKSNYFEEKNVLTLSLLLKEKYTNSDTYKAKNDYKNSVKQNILKWKQSDKEKVNAVFSKILPIIREHSPRVISDTLYLIKSNKNIEYGFPFTKNKAIIIPKKIIKSSNLINILIHEMFHIYSSNNLEKRDALYALIGFEKVIDFSLSNELEELRIINPDDNIIDYYKINLLNTSCNERQDYIVLFLSKYPMYDGYKGIISRINILLGYYTIKLIRIVEENEKWKVAIKNEKPELYDKKDAPEYWQKIKFAHNMTETPEETLAEDFGFLIRQKMNKYKPEKFSEKEIIFFKNFEKLLK